MSPRRDHARAQLASYATRAWQITDHGHDPERAAALESILAVGNGYLGVRGAHEEGTPSYDPGVIVNGFHETWPIVYPEDAFGLARTGQTLVGAPDGSILRLVVDDEPFELTTARLLTCERTLDMRTGVLTREVVFTAPRSGRIRIRSRRLASLADRHLVALDYEVCALDGPARIAILSELVTHAPRTGADDPRRGRGFAERVLRPVVARADGTRAALRLATAAQRARAGLRHGPPDRGRSAGRGRARRRGRPRRGAPARRPAGGRAAPRVQVRRLPLGAAGGRARPARARRRHARRGHGRRPRRRRGGARRARRRVLAPQRRRDRRGAGGPAGRPLQPLLAHAGDRRAARATASPPRA